MVITVYMHTSIMKNRNVNSANCEDSSCVKCDNLILYLIVYATLTICLALYIHYVPYFEYIIYIWNDILCPIWIEA